MYVLFASPSDSPPDPLGSLEVSASTTGDNQDSDGYAVTVGGSTSKKIDPNGSATFSGLNEGNHRVELTGLKANCSVGGPNPRTVSVTAGNPASTSYSATCTSSNSSGLTVHPNNPRYLWNGSNTVTLIGGGGTVHPSSDGQLPVDKNNIDEWSRNGANFARIWTILPWEGTNTTYPWKRTGPGTANDGGPKFDLTKFNEEYFDRMDELLAHNPNFYLQYMLFDEAGLRDYSSGRWRQHPFNPENNVNNLGLPGSSKDGLPEFYDTSNSDLMAIQEDYVQKVIDELDHHSNLIYEIANETSAPWGWQKKWVDFINARTSTLIASNPLGDDRPWRTSSDNITDNLAEPGLDIFNYHNLQPGSTNDRLLDFHQEAENAGTPKVVKFDEQVYDNPTGSKVRRVAWESFTAGGHLNWDAASNKSAAKSTSDHLASFLSGNGINPATMAPDNSLVDAGFALANPGTEYVVFTHDSQSVTIDLSSASGSLEATWFDTATGNYSSTTSISGGGNVTLTNPFGTDVVLYIHD
jgi:hypothetical protein